MVEWFDLQLKAAQPCTVLGWGITRKMVIACEVKVEMDICFVDGSYWLKKAMDSY